MTSVQNFVINILPALGFILAVVLLAHIIRQRRSPTSTLAWLLAIIFIPYIGVPFYLMFGGRKMKHQAAEKPSLEVELPETKSHHSAAAFTLGGLFSPTRGNRISLYPDGVQAYGATLDLIKSAKQTICVATFILGRGNTGEAILAALTIKAVEGVQVFLLLDALGSVHIKKRFLAPLIEAGGQAAFFMPMLHIPFRGRANLRNHRKMVIVDGRSAIVGGMNLAEEYMGLNKDVKRWQDLSLSIDGPACSQIYEIFRSDWRFASRKDLESLKEPEMQTGNPSGDLIQVMASGPDVEADTLRDSIITGLFHAKSRVWIVTPYFVPDELLLEALCLAAKRGIDLRLVIPKKSNHLLADLAREGYLSQLQECGASVFLYSPRMLHAKALILDDTVAITGSANMDMRSLLLNYELAICIYSQDMIIQLEDWIGHLMKESVERSPRKNQTLLLLEGVGRLFAPLI